MTTNYIATAYPSQLVKFSAVGCFLNDKQQHLLTVKSRCLELYGIDQGELVECKQVRVPCSIAGLWSFKPKNSAKDLLVLLTQRFELLVMELLLNLKNQVQIHMRCNGIYPSNEDLIKLDAGPFAIFHPEQRFMCLAIYAQRFEIVEFSSDLGNMKSYPIRCGAPDGGKILSMEFLSLGSNADCTMAILQGTNRGQVLSFSSLNIRSKEKEKPMATFSKLDFEADVMLIVPGIPGNKAVPAGALIIGNGSVQYYNTLKHSVCAVSPFLSKMVVTAHCVLYKDLLGNVVTYLLGGADGRLVLVVVRLNSQAVVDEAGGDKKPPCRINIEFIGIASAAQTLSVMSDGLVFLGTSSGPASLLIKLRDSSRNPETKFYYDVIQKFPALGSILELHVVKSAEKHGLDETSLLACTSDTFGTSLTSIRSGINLEDPVQIPLAGIQKAWYVSSIGKGDFEEKQTFILTDFTTTRYCTLEKEDFLEVALSGDLNLTARTIFFHQMSESVCLQVTPIAVQLFSRLDYKSLEIWSVEELSISTARLLKNSLAIANGHRIHILDIVEEKILPGLEMSFEHELCALEIFSDFTGTLFLAVGEWITWNVSIVECSTASMTVIQDQLSPSDIQPRSLMFCQFTEDVAYFFIGRGDGNVDYFQFDQRQKKMCEAKRIPLGTRLVTFTQFHAHDQVYVFACSDRPCVIFCRNGKLLFSNVNIPDAVDVCPFVPAMLDGATGATDCLMVITATSLLIGQLEDIQKIHFTSIPLGFQVFRLAFRPGTTTLAVIGDKKDSRMNKFAIHKSSDCTDDRLVYILDRNSFEVITTFQCPEEAGCLACLCHWSPSDKSLLVLGTAKERDGSLIILELIHDRLQVLHTYTTSSEPVRNVLAYGDFLLATTDNALFVFEWLGHQMEVRQKLETGGSLNCHLDILGNTVLVGDYQKPLFIADFNLTSNELNVLAKDFTAYNFLSVMLRNRDTVMGGDDRGNLLVLTKTDIVEGDALSPSLQPISWISVGDPVTTIKRGSLVSPESIGDISVIVRDSFVYGTCKGQLGVIFELEDHLFKLLKDLERFLLSTTTLIGTLDLTATLQLCTRLMEAPHTGFVDGDLIQTALLHIARSDLDRILSKFLDSQDDDDIKRRYATSEVLLKILDDLLRLY